MDPVPSGSVWVVDDQCERLGSEWGVFYHKGRIHVRTVAGIL
jgi:hypothetical protein